MCSRQHGARSRRIRTAAPQVSHTSHVILREAMRNQLVTGVRLDRKFFSTKARQKFNTVCHLRQSKDSFPRSQERDQVTDLRQGKRVGADVLIILNVPTLVAGG